jgi:hypothetical protein
MIGNEETVSALRKFEVANGISFPVFNVAPVLSVESDLALSILRKLEASVKKGNASPSEAAHLLDVLWQTSRLLWGEAEFKRIKNCLESVPQRLSSFVGEAPSNLEAWNDLVKASQTLATRVEDLPRVLWDALVSGLSESRETFLTTLRDLVATSQPRKTTTKKVQFVLELSDRSTYQYPANHSKVRQWVNSRLLDREREIRQSETSRSDAFGLPLPDESSRDMFPSVRLPVLGNVILRAMSSESPCQRRYGQSDASSFPAGLVTRRKMKDALEWLGDKSRRGRTWQDISRLCGFDRGVLFAYPALLMEDPPEVAGMFAGMGEEDEGGDKFIGATQRVIPALSGILSEAPDCQVRVFVLAKADQARTKVLLSRNVSVGSLVDGARSWQGGCANLPQLRLRVTGYQQRQRDTRIPFPTEVAWILNTKWDRSCAKASRTHDATMTDGFALLLGEGTEAENAARKVLSLTVRNASSLFLTLGHVDHRGKEILAVRGDDLMVARSVAPLMGLALHKLGREKEDYMSSPEFLVGRLLAMADLLHREYCVHVRGGSIPPQLLGNSLMPMAGDNPERALARLMQRLTVYRAWVDKTYSDKPSDAYGLARWAVSQMGLIAKDLSKAGIPRATDDAVKAQLLLGYLSRSESGGSDSPKDTGTEEVARSE